jgi:FAD/FMN-containing dehydrogenase
MTHDTFDRPTVTRQTQAIAERLSALDWIADKARVERLSQDFSWFSPVLKRDLAGLAADAVVRPRTEDEIRAVVAACAAERVPLTLRGSGTGNYGQCTPLYGGIILDLSGYNQLLWSRSGVARAQAGIRMMEMDRQTQQPEPNGGGRPSTGWELRCIPSTFRSATLGGLYGGGFGGIGSINHGPLASTGNVLGIKAMTIEPEPRTIELRAPEALLLHHVYGTNGLVLEIEVALAPAHPWLEAIVTFTDFDSALVFADTVANAPGIVKKSVTFLAAPIPDHLSLLAASLPRGEHAVLLAVSEPSEPALLEMIGAAGGQLTLRKTADEVRASNRTILEFTWNHTTLHALKVDKGLTYIQSGFQAGQHVAQAKAMRKLFGDEVLLHLEFIRTKEGLMTCSGLQLVRYSTEARLNEIMQMHRDRGVYIANPHVYQVEDGKQGQVNPDVVAAKMRFDPQGLLNPGKLRGWAVRDEIAADAQAGRLSLATLPSF